MDNKRIVEIIVNKPSGLTDDELINVANDFKARLSGYTTVMPEELRGASINLNPVMSEEKKYDFNEVAILIKAFHLDVNKGEYTKELLDWCDTWINNHVIYPI